MVSKHLKSNMSATVLKHSTHHRYPNSHLPGSIVENISIHLGETVDSTWNSQSSLGHPLLSIASLSATVSNTQNGAWSIGVRWEGWLVLTLAAACRLGPCSLASISPVGACGGPANLRDGIHALLV